ncbi:MAG TPA: choice-of-anchor E domain-containing protein [Flavisolibacter sp.]|nr:choice-of-anchor E domain-containing protein [Flavisolibacter sp.]
MLKRYSLLSYSCLFLLLLYGQNSQAQCAGGYPSGTAVYDTTIRFPTGATNMQVKFPKFDPQMAMLSCVRLVVTIVGVVDSVAMQNFSGSSQTANFSYIRTDAMSGPGLTPSLSNNFNGNYGPYTLAASDGLPGGPDTYTKGKDTVLKSVMARTLTDSTEISQFYGSDSVVYDYNINVSANASITGGSSLGMVLTSAYVNFRFEYCTCPLHALPVGFKNFTATKTGALSADLRWEAEASADRYFYEIELSRDGRNFTKAATVQKAEAGGNASYRFSHALQGADFGRYYFRIKQRWLDGYYRYSDIRSVEYSNPLFSTASIYPNPSNGNIGIKFVAGKAGAYLVQVTNAVGQVVLSKDVKMAETDYKPVGSLPRGTYYVKLTDVASRASNTYQILVQ